MNSILRRSSEFLFWFLSGATLLIWSTLLVSELAPKFLSGLNLEIVILKNSGASALLLSLVIISAVAFFASIMALRSKPLPAGAASILLITVAGLRSIQILTDGSVTIFDAQLMGALFLGAAVLYNGNSRLWWTALMPLAVVAMFAPLGWLEFYKGASNVVLVRALIVPLAAFLIGLIVVVLRELSQRAGANVSMLRLLRARSESTMKDLRSMEADMKLLRSYLSADVQPMSTMQFETTEVKTEATETCSFEEIDLASRRLLEEARAAIGERPVRISLTAPTSSAGLPIAVRGNAVGITSWMKSLILQSIESLGGFKDGMVRVTIKPSIGAVAILIEDNGRGFSESALAKAGVIEDGRFTVSQVRDAVEALGGRFDILARLGVGSRYSIELPRVDAFANPPRVSARLNSIHAPSVRVPSSQSLH